MSTQPSVKRSVRDFYDRIGWQKDAHGIFADAAKFEDLRPVSAEYRSRCLLRVNKFLARNGTFLLDVASGPLQHPEHKTYSDGFKKRICADMSFSALREARTALQGRCSCVQGDIVHLPFKDETIDGVISLHTVYHVPADEQIQAFREIGRVLTRDHTAVVVYTWGNHSFLMALAMAPLLPLRLGRKIITAIVRRTQSPVAQSSHTPQLYFHPHTRRYLVRHLEPHMKFDVLVWRSLSVPCLKLYFHTWLFGRFLLNVIYTLEDVLPRLMGRCGAYPLFVVKK
jgi:ubiquinone/menaquinone biosynthesis C-methylase UbiE